MLESMGLFGFLVLVADIWAIINIAQARIEQLMATPFDPTGPVAALNPAFDEDDAEHQETFVSESGRQYDVAWNTTYLDLNGDGDNDALAIEMKVNWFDLYGQRGLTVNFRKTARSS